MRRVRSAIVLGASPRLERSGRASSNEEFNSYSLMEGSPAARQRFDSNYRNTGLLRKFDARTGAFTDAAIDPHFVVSAKQHLQPFIHVIDANTLLEQSSQLCFRN